MADLDVSQCCDSIETLMDGVETAADAALTTATTETDELVELINDPAGVFVTAPGPHVLPTLSEIVGRVHNFAGGFAVWSFYESTSTTRTAINIPASMTTSAKIGVDINGARLRETVDYTHSGTVITLTHALEIGDLITVKTYGDP